MTNGSNGPKANDTMTIVTGKVLKGQMKIITFSREMSLLGIWMCFFLSLCIVSVLTVLSRGCETKNGIAKILHNFISLAYCLWLLNDCANITSRFFFRFLFHHWVSSRTCLQNYRISKVLFLEWFSTQKVSHLYPFKHVFAICGQINSWPNPCKKYGWW